MLHNEQIEIKSTGDIGDVIRSRRTIHSFKPDPVPESMVLEAIETARWAPNHKMTEPWRFYLLGPNTVSRLANLNTDLFMVDKTEAYKTMKRAKWMDMPVTLVVTSQVGQDALRDKENYAATCCAIHNYSLYLWNEGIGVKWSTTKLTRAVEMYELLGIDTKSEEIVGILWSGYPDEIPCRDRSPVEASVVRVP